MRQWRDGGGKEEGGRWGGKGEGRVICMKGWYEG